MYKQMPSQNPMQQAFVAPAPVIVEVPVVEESKYITIKSPIIGTFIENHLQINQCLLKESQKEMFYV
jgi:hypothetical protein